jgi:DNA-binding XRE family transcriptional regulator
MVKKEKRKPAWDAGAVQALRRHLGLTQQQLADEMGTRQQTISEWETGLYEPRGASSRLLTIIAERARLRGREEGGGDPRKRRKRLIPAVKIAEQAASGTRERLPEYPKKRGHRGQGMMGRAACAEEEATSPSWKDGVVEIEDVLEQPGKIGGNERDGLREAKGDPAISLHPPSLHEQELAV